MKKLFFILILVLSLAGCQTKDIRPTLNLDNLNWGMEASIALDKAEKLFQEAKDNNLDLSSGPCLSNSLHGNSDYPETIWVFDIAHNPRQEIDNDSANQCQAFANGQAYNYIEFSPDGELIKIYSPFLKESK